MKMEDLKKTSSAPVSGLALIYTRSQIIFRPYSSIEEVARLTEGEDILEMHLFDAEKEYRCIAAESKHFESSGGVIEYISDFKESEETVFKESVLLENKAQESSGRKMITVLNHISYDLNPASGSGMAFIDDYRLKG